ncbi:MAG: AsnC family transcriptional regulator [Burkholderiales bacterium]|nr:AsnC family transcriptional regulator [Burkholderiales bacterium]
MDELDRAVVNRLQHGVEVAARPFAPVAAALDVEEDALLARIARLLADGALTRFGPMYDATAMGGAFTLAAMSVPAADFDRVAALVNAHPEVAHNYEREHALNMWFVVACERPEAVARVIADIERETGLAVLDLPKLDEYFLDLRIAV